MLFVHELTHSSVAELADYPKIALGHYPTPLQFMPRLSDYLQSCQLYVKRDDCTGLGLGGNKVRQLEYYLGDALAKGCDTVLGTGAVQSNFMRMLAAAAGKLGLQCYVQLEDRVPAKSKLYHSSGNPMLSSLFGAHVCSYAGSQDETEADKNVRKRAQELAASGRKPYVVPLRPVSEPKGALGYVDAAFELVAQCRELDLHPDLVVVGSGSGMTHSGLLVGLRLQNFKVPVLGACVRRSAARQAHRICNLCKNLCRMMGKDELIDDSDVNLTDVALFPGYGQVNELVIEAINLAATHEGLLLDPVYTGKTMGSIIALNRSGQLGECKKVIFMHTGGAPALFAYQHELQASDKREPQ